jgi:hypothetical protein
MLIHNILVLVLSNFFVHLEHMVIDVSGFKIVDSYLH